MPLSGMLTCGNCGTRTQMNSMRYNLSGSKLICPDCIEKERSGIKPGTTHSRSARLQQEQMAQKTTTTTMMSVRSGAGAARPSGTQQSDMQMEAAGGAGGEGMARYVCRSCHFKFSRKRDIEIGTCPYCGRDAVSPTYEGKAQDLIEESTHEEEMF